MHALMSMKFEDPEDGEAVVRERFAKLGREIEEKFRSVMDNLN